MSASGANLEESNTLSPSASSRTILRALGVALALSLLCVLLRRVDFGRVVELLRGLGPSAALVVVPSMLALTCETLAWGNAFRLVGERVPFWSLVRVRVTSESLGTVLPLGALWADAVKPRLLARICHTRTSTNLVAIAARKYLLVLSQGAYLVLGFVLGHRLLGTAFERTLGSRSFAVLALAAGVALALLAEGMAFSLRGGAAFRAVLHAAKRLPSKPLRRRIDRCAEEMARTDGTATRFFGATLSTRFALAIPCLAGWLLEATETWTILHVLGTGLSWGDAVGVEALVVLARNVLAVLPGGLGAQELGYATLLAGAGVDMSVSATLMLLKRARELSWVLVGGLLFASGSLASARLERLTEARVPTPAE